jgi:hypothetical protein
VGMARQNVLDANGRVSQTAICRHRLRPAMTRSRKTAEGSCAQPVEQPGEALCVGYRAYGPPPALSLSSRS